MHDHLLALHITSRMLTALNSFIEFLCPVFCFQDILRLLTLWFSYGATSEVLEALQKGFSLVKIEMWLVVLPQIIARIHSNNKAVR